MARFARSALDAGAVGLRLHGAADIAEARAMTSVPIIGIHKEEVGDGRILITPTFERAAEIFKAGADAVAIDCTARGVRYGALERLSRVRRDLGVATMADIATIGQALDAVKAGADFVLPTMRGYTDETRDVAGFDLAFLAELCAAVPVPVIAEGRVETPGDALRALHAGAFAVVVGSAITRPHEIARSFVRALEPPGWTGAIDLGGSRIKWGVVDPAGALAASGHRPTPVQEGAGALLASLADAARECMSAANAPLDAFGVATAGWVDRRGIVQYSTGNLPGFAGADIRRTIADATGLRVVVENDAVAATAGEWTTGARGIATTSSA